MEIAKPADWKTYPLPKERTTVSIDRIFSVQEMKRIRKGLIPKQMEDKWFIYWENDTLFFHRSWTGFCICVIHFAKEDKNFRIIEADINRSSKQYKETNDDNDIKMISYLIDVLLMRKEAFYPCEEKSPEEKAVMMWSNIGRAMLGKHPDDK